MRVSVRVCIGVVWFHDGFCHDLGLRASCKLSKGSGVRHWAQGSGFIVSGLGSRKIPKARPLTLYPQACGRKSWSEVGLDD